MFIPVWMRASGEMNYDLPKSCCVRTKGDIVHDCPWENFFKNEDGRSLKMVDAEIYRTGCLTVLDNIYHEEVGRRGGYKLSSHFCFRLFLFYSQSSCWSALPWPCWRLQWWPWLLGTWLCSREGRRSTDMLGRMVIMIRSSSTHQHI